MRNPFIFLAAALVAGVGACSQKSVDDFVFVQGGAFKNTRSNYQGKSVTVADFYISKYEVTQKEWMEVMGSNPSTFKGDNLPVETVTWYESIEYCNKRSLKEGLMPYYQIDTENKDPNNRNEADDLKWTVTINAGANGYRLPTEAEWEYAAGGGQLSKGYTYSGSNDLDKVGWFWENSGDTKLTGAWSWPRVQQNHDRTHPVGDKEPNELGLYDMSGNVREFCWDWYAELPSKETDFRESASGSLRVWKGGGWIGGDFTSEPTFRAGYEQFYRGPDQGFRVCRGR